jgi:hypothetical protein
MARERDLVNQSPNSVEHGKIRAVADEDLVRVCVDPNVVGIAPEGKGPCLAEVCCAEGRDVPAAPAGNDHQVAPGEIGDALGFLQASDAVKHLTGRYVDGADRIIPQFRDEEAPAGDVERKMVYPPHDATKRDLPFEF